MNSQTASQQFKFWLRAHDLTKQPARPTSPKFFISVVSVECVARSDDTQSWKRNLLPFYVSCSRLSSVISRAESWAFETGFDPIESSSGA